MYVPLQLRLTLLYVFLLGLALWFFGYLIYTQAAKRASRDLDATLSSRASSVKLGKYVVNPSTLPSLLPGIAGVGSESVAIEVLDMHLHLVATTDSHPADFSQTSVVGTDHSPVPWDAQAAQRILQHPFVNTMVPNSMYSTLTYQGQQIRVYTLANGDFGEVHIIQTVRSEQDIERSLSNLKMVLLGGDMLVILFASLGGWFITLGVLTRVRHITQTARDSSERQSFSQRVADQTWGVRDELSRLAETFNTMLDDLERLYQCQQRFVADASHELRAPITSICCNLDLLAKAPDLPEEDAQAALADARAEVGRMGRLVNDLLVLARADAEQSMKCSGRKSEQQLEERKKLIDLDSLLLEVFRQYRLTMDNKEDEAKRQPRLLLHHIIPVQVSGDADQLKQVLVALVDNALKYTPPEGMVSLTLTIDEYWAIIEVNDTGIGIGLEDIPHIFERFYRTRSARSYDQRGGGLGLAIAQSIIQEYQGMIDVESVSGKGSTFTIRIPL